MKTNCILTVLCIVSFTFALQAQDISKVGERPETLATLAGQFNSPADEYKPHAWWHWLGSNFSKEGMTKDLHAMKESGIGGVVIFNAPSWLDPKKNPWQERTYRSEAYWDALNHALSEAKKLNMVVGIHNSPGWSTTGGTWISPTDGMQSIAYSKTKIHGKQVIEVKLQNPKLDDPKVAEYFKDIAVIAVAASDEVTADNVLDISEHMNTQGLLKWNAPEGEWTIYRVGHYPTLTRSHPTPEDVTETSLEVDKMNPDANLKHWHSVLEPFKTRFGKYIGTTFKYIWIDSYEAGDQNWSPNFRADFIKIKGYDPVVQVVLADARGDKIIDTAKGRFIGAGKDAAPETKLFLKDHAEVVNRLYMNCWQIGKEQINKAGFTFCWEPYCSWGGGPFEITEGVGISDIPVTEFWIHSGDVFGGYTIANAAATTGKRIVGAEAFTGMEATCKFTETPYMLKRPADMGYAHGVNLYFLHSWAHNPFDNKYQPGFSFAHYGTHFSRNQTWYEPGKAFFTYLARCQMILQQGSFIGKTPDGVHRRTPEADIFFVRNTGNTTEKNIDFPIKNRTPEIWDAYSGKIKNIKNYKQTDNTTTIKLRLEKDESVFVIFPLRKTNYEKLPDLAELNKTEQNLIGNDWNVTFKPKTNEEPFQRKFTALTDFSKNTDPAVKYFSGTATYESTMSLADTDLSKGKTVTIDLGELYDIAELEVNGKKAGVLWCPPYKIDITKFVNTGANNIKIHITNTWVNRLIGDEQHPEDFDWTDKNQGLRAMKSLPDWFTKNQPRPTKERKTFIPWYYYNKNSDLKPAGLLGPIKLLKQEFQP
jgi:hypothetical protein